MPNYKSITLAGHVGQDSAHRVTPSGDDVLNFSIAVNSGPKDAKSTEWFACALWGKRASVLAPWITRGKALLVVGEPTLKTFTKKDGTPGSQIAIRVDKVEFLGGGEQAPEQHTAPTHQPAPAFARTPEAPDYGEDVQF